MNQEELKNNEKHPVLSFVTNLFKNKDNIQDTEEIKQSDKSSLDTENTCTTTQNTQSATQENIITSSSLDIQQNQSENSTVNSPNKKRFVLKTNCINESKAVKANSAIVTSSKSNK
ncbi:hypothetical protein [Tepidibacter aestuarii]|uniref:hypothetical protein n=1 Tax=Tepidibacter aestuarii TaxID=2925782 RepID=UPI0020C0876D|nr:hypothetical protein [Tepidibacter aestuarii]CAH2214311.1 protein of unknown function [Tepidibacter aestuarii]